MKIALITGASSGLGKTFAHEIDRTCPDIDELWLVARRRDRLEKLADSLTENARIFPLDLTRESSVDSLKYELARQGDVRVAYFIAAAGSGKIGDSSTISDGEAAAMIDLNCKAAVLTTQAVIPYMKAGDHIIEICSTSSFQPLSYLNIYAASKAFLYNYTRALRMELLQQGIKVTAVCPWWIKDTEFIGEAKVNKTGADTEEMVSGFPFATTEKKVVSRALRASRLGMPVCTPDIMSTLHRIFGKLLPRQAMIYIWEAMRHMK